MRRARHSLSSVCALVVTVVCLLAALTPAGASAFTEPGFTGAWSDYANCPIPTIVKLSQEGHSAACVHSFTTGGIVKIGHSSTPITIPGNTLDWGATEPETYPENIGVVVSPPHGVINGPAQPVPGGLLGSIGGSRVSGVKARLEWVPTPPNSVIGTAEVSQGTDPFVTYSFSRLLNGLEGTAVTLSTRIHLISPFLGPECFIGSTEDPIVIQLTTGTTEPPPPAVPVHGKAFDKILGAGENRLLGLEVTFVNNSFSVPGASGCGTSTGDLVDRAIDYKIGLPSPAGQNSILLNVEGETAPALNVLGHWTGENNPSEESEEATGEDTGASALPGVPSGRANEMVSPVAKNGLSPYAAVPSKDGDSVDFQTRGALPGSGSGALNLYRATRGAGGWQTTSLTPTPPDPLKALEIQAPAWLSGDLSQTIFTTPAAYTLADQDGGALSIYHSDSTGLSLLSQGTQGGDEGKHATFDGATPDGQHVVFSSGASLLPDATPLESRVSPEAEYLYGRDLESGETQLLNVDSGGQITGSVTTTLVNESQFNAPLTVPRISGLFPGQVVTVGTGASADTVQIYKISNETETTEALGVKGLQYQHPVGTPVTHLSEGAILGDGVNVTSGPVPSTEYMPSNAASGSTTNAISSDGSKVFFESPSPGRGQPVGLYMRQGNTTKKIAGARKYGTTIQGIFGSEQAVDGSARYQGAAADGSLVFFSSEEGLAGGAAVGNEIYEFNTTGHEIGGVPSLSVKPLSAGLGGDQAPETTVPNGLSGGEETIQVASTSGFSAGETVVLDRFEINGNKFNSTATATIKSVDSATQLTLVTSFLGTGLSGVPASTRLHSIHSAAVTAISTDGSHVYFTSDGVLAENVNAEGGMAAVNRPNLYVFDTTTGETIFITTLARRDVADGEGVPQNLDAESETARPAVPTPDGSVLAFASAGNLTGQNPARKFTEVYRYSVSGETLECLSCTAPGVPPTGDANFGETAGGTYDPPGLTSPMTEDGSTVFFDTPDSLVPGDMNSAAPPSAKFEDPTSTDVYQWTSAGLSMLSSGTSTTPAILQGTNPSGSDVLFATTGLLVPDQNDGGYENIIDARLGGGFPAGEGAGAPSCAGESCREAFGEAPLFGPPATLNSSGETPVVGQPKKKKHPKKNKKKHHAKKRADHNRRAGK